MTNQHFARRGKKMAAGSTVGRTAIKKRHRDLLLTAAIMTYLLVTLGGIVCVTDSSRGCPDWPGCYGRIVPPMRSDAIIESLHRLLAGLTSVTIIAAALVGWFKSRSIRWVSRPPLVAVGFLLVAAVLGALVVLRGLSPGMAAVDLGSALMVLALMLSASVVATALHDNPALPDRLFFRGPFSRLALCSSMASLSFACPSALSMPRSTMFVAWALRSGSTWSSAKPTPWTSC
jgi:heme A synthase